MVSCNSGNFLGTWMIFIPNWCYPPIKNLEYGFFTEQMGLDGLR